MGNQITEKMETAKSRFPDFYPTVVIWQPIDERFDIFDYFIEDGEDCDTEVKNPKKVVADWLENEDLELIHSIQDYSIYLDWDEQKIFISNQEEGYESEQINFISFGADFFDSSRFDLEDIVIHIAEQFIAGKQSTLTVPGQLELALRY